MHTIQKKRIKLNPIDRSNFMRFYYLNRLSTNNIVGFLVVHLLLDSYHYPFSYNFDLKKSTLNLVNNFHPFWVNLSL